MEKRVLLAVFLSFLVLYGYQTLVVKSTPPTPSRPQTNAGSGVAPSAVSTQANSTVSQAPAPAQEPAVPSIQTLVADSAEEETVIETELVRAVFSNRGAVLTSWKLKKFLDPRQQPLELVPDGLPGHADRPFSLTTSDQATTTRLNQAIYHRAIGEGPIDARQRPAMLSYEYRDAGGVSVSKVFSLEPRSYVVTLTVSLSVDGKAVVPGVNWGPALGDAVSAGESNRYIQQPEGIVFLDRQGAKRNWVTGALEEERLSVSALAKQHAYTGQKGFAGVDDHYFLSAALSSGNLTVEFTPHTIPASPPAPQRSLVAYTTRSPKDTQRFFVGPKDFDVLAAVDRDLVRVINYGWFSWLVVPLLRSLKWINNYVGNYGWSIIILTILINAVMFPLRHKSVVSMRKMQELQPEVKAIQDRYAKFKTTDPERQKMNTEMMSLYRERGVNPASGCVPMLLTMPVLFAFYSLLSQSIEIRGAHFMGWITDLSMHDPLYVTPILMGITMFVQQRMTPSTADPAQQRMMMFMPLVFLFMFLWAPSGLVLYWLVSNLWAIGQQYLTNRLIGPPVVHSVRPPAERRVKKLSGAK